MSSDGGESRDNGQTGIGREEFLDWLIHFSMAQRPLVVEGNPFVDGFAFENRYPFNPGLPQSLFDMNSEIGANIESIVVQTPEQALKWLDSTYDGNVDLSDESILALATAKVADRPEHAETARTAVKILAEYRNSDGLRSWLVGGDHFISGDPVAEAYRFFNIEDRTATVDTGVLQALMDMIITEDPSKADDATRHFNVLLNYVSGQSAQNNVAPDYENPVGLSNMGNTCYLNCLLQYFYTIKPLREVILQFDSYKIDIADPGYQSKKVDSQVISKLHVERTQECKLPDVFVLVIH